MGLDAARNPLIEPGSESLKVELIVKALSPGFEEDGKLGKSRNGLEKPLGLQAGLPKRRPLVKAGSGQEQGSSGTLPEPSAKIPRRLETTSKEIFEVGRADEGQSIFQVGLGRDKDQNLIVSR